MPLGAAAPAGAIQSSIQVLRKRDTIVDQKKLVLQTVLLERLKKIDSAKHAIPSWPSYKLIVRKPNNTTKAATFEISLRYSWSKFRVTRTRSVTFS